MPSLRRTRALPLTLSRALDEELDPDRVPVTCRSPGPTRAEVGEVAGFGGSALLDRLAMESPLVVAAGLRGLDRNKAVVIPGLVNKIAANGGRFGPRSVVRKIAGAIKY